MSLNNNSDKMILTLNPTKLLLGMLLLCGLLTGVLPQLVVDFAVVSICILLLINGNLVFAYPFMLFYYGTFGLVLGLSTYRIFSLLLLFEGMMKLKNKVQVQMGIVLSVLIYGIYLLAVMSSYSIQRAVFCFVDILCALIVVSHFNKNSEFTRKFFKIYVVVALISIVSGMVLKNALIEDRVVENYTISRFMATFEDPNYMGFFMSIAVFATVSLRLFKPIMRWVAIIAIYVAILASASISAIVVHAILWPIYLAASKKLSTKALLAYIMVVFVLLSLYQYGLNNPDAAVVGNISYRVQEKLKDWESGDMSGVTTNRSDLTKAHWEYFLQQPFWKKLFGGTPVNTVVISEEFDMVSHNEYVGLLLNVGLVGASLMLWFMFKKTYNSLKAYCQSRDEAQLCIFMAKCVWIIYAATLTLFLEFRFMLPFFI